MSRPQRILVTGAAGFIGSSLVDRLLAEGRQVVGLDSFDPFYDEEQKRRNLESAQGSGEFRLHQVDIRDRERVDQLFAQESFDAVVHLAALAGVRRSLERPADYVDVNIHGTAILLDAAARRGGSHFVFGSSSSVYGERSDGPFRETDSVERPISPYAATKRAAELLAHTFHHAHGLSVTCLRFFTVYGPRQRPDLAIRKFAELMLRGQAIPVYGDGSSLRDFTFVADTVDGIVRALDRDLGFSILNLGAGRTVSVKQVIETLEKNLETVARIEWLPKQTGDVSRTWANIDAAKESLGYEPNTQLEEGVGAFVEWLRKQP